MGFNAHRTLGLFGYVGGFFGLLALSHGQLQQFAGQKHCVVEADEGGSQEQSDILNVASLFAR